MQPPGSADGLPWPQQTGHEANGGVSSLLQPHAQSSCGSTSSLANGSVSDMQQSQALVPHESLPAVSYSPAEQLQQQLLQLQQQQQQQQLGPTLQQLQAQMQAEMEMQAQLLVEQQTLQRGIQEQRQRMAAQQQQQQQRRRQQQEQQDSTALPPEQLETEKQEEFEQQQQVQRMEGEYDEQMKRLLGQQRTMEWLMAQVQQKMQPGIRRP